MILFLGLVNTGTVFRLPSCRSRILSSKAARYIMVPRTQHTKQRGAKLTSTCRTPMRMERCAGNIRQVCSLTYSVFRRKPCQIVQKLLLTKNHSASIQRFNENFAASETHYTTRIPKLIVSQSLVSWRPTCLKHKRLRILWCALSKNRKFSVPHL